MRIIHNAPILAGHSKFVKVLNRVKICLDPIKMRELGEGRAESRTVYPLLSDPTFAKARGERNGARSAAGGERVLGNK